MSDAKVLRTLVVDDEPLPRERVVTLVRETAGLELVGQATSGTEALDQIVALRPDLLFLDIQLPEMDGFEVVDALGDEAPPAVVFVTAYDEYAVRAFEVDAIDYLLKPVSAERFSAAVHRLRDRLTRPGVAIADRVRDALARAGQDRAPTPRRRFVVRRGNTHSFVPVADVEWIDAEGNYLRLHVGRQSHLVRLTMKTLESELAAHDFVRIHRSILVNVDRIATITPSGEGEYVVVLRDGTRLGSSRGYADRVRALLA
jgi:two-component system, LytTR family, response regulator